MAVTVKKVTLWRTEVENKPGALSSVLTPLAEAGADLQVVMGYHYHKAGDRAIIEVCPVKGKKSDRRREHGWSGCFRYPHAARPGQQQPGLGPPSPSHRRGGINVTFLVAQVIDKRFSAVMGFEDERCPSERPSCSRRRSRNEEVAIPATA